MKFSYEVFPERRTIVARYAGTFTVGDLVNSAQLIWGDPNYSRDYSGIVDLSDTSAMASLGDFRGFLKFIRLEPRVSRGRWAVITATPFATACSFMYRSAMAGRHTLEIFSTWEAACGFINLGLPRDVPLHGGIDDTVTH